MAIATAVTVTGCLIFPHGAYYKPAFDYPGRRLEGHIGGSCPPWVGPKTTLVVPLLKGVELEAGFDRTENDGDFYFYVSFRDAKPDTTLRVTGDSIMFRDLDTGRTLTLPASAWTVQEWNSTVAEYQPVESQAVAAPHSVSRTTSMRIPGFGISHVEVTLPAFEIDGQRIELPSIRFNYRRLDLGIYPLNC